MHFTKVSYILLISFLVLFVLSNISLYMLNEDTIKKVDILDAQLRETQTTIDDIKSQIRVYEEENYRLKNTVSSQTNEIKKLSRNSAPVAPVEHIHPDTYILAQLIESESGNQSFKGKLAVGTVVMNRVENDEFPDTIKEVIFQKRQFSVVSDGSINNEPSAESLKAAKVIMGGLRSLDSNVLYFYNPKLTKKTNWITSRKIDKVIGDHAFAV